MTQVVRSLEEIATVYRIFEKDQVLTHDQLNSIASYLDDQARLTRVKLLGVGIVCGLRPSIEGGQVKITKGVGVTTDGDLLYFMEEIRFDRFRPYDASNPAYPPFRSGEDRLLLFELVPQGIEDPRAAPLTQFIAQTGKPLGDMVALLLMESYVKDDDLCSGTDCDNLGKDCVNTPKLLLTDRAGAAALKEAIGLPNDAAGALTPIAADRPLLPSSITSLGQLGQFYRVACNAVHNKLVAEFPKLYPNISPFLSEEFPADPATGWITRLNAIKAGAADLGIQYYYDFLKDLVETYNRFLDALFGDTTWCCPDFDAFPKHLLLGALVSGANPEEHRTGCYPSPLVSRTADQLHHATFLLRKIDAMIQTFQVPPGGSAPIRVTPSFTEERSLEERAIPYYYPFNATAPIHKRWNYRLHRRGMDANNYSYHAAAYGAQGAAAAPLTSQIGPYSFFRVEGHLGKPVTAALAEIERGIQANNLPFTVRAVMLGTDRGQVVRPPKVRYTDLHRFHYLLRQDLFHRLDDVSEFSGKFKQQVDASVADEPNGTTLKNIAEQKNNTVSGKTGSARTKLNKKYSEYKADPTWKEDLNDTMTAAGEFKFNLGEVVKTEFPTPFDSLIGHTNDRWLDLLDGILQGKEEKEDEKLLFSKFISQHPGLEHFGGVVRGGTFVLLYDSSRNVVADLMLDYICCETAEEEDEPPLPKPFPKPGWLIDHGIKILPSLDKFVKGKFNLFENELNQKWQPKLDLQKEYFNTFKESIGMMGNVLVNVGKGQVPSIGDKFTDPLLGVKVNETRLIREKVDLLKQKAAQTNLPPEDRRKLEAETKTAEADLARSIEETARHISDSGIDVSAEGEGLKAMLEVSSGLKVLTDAEALNRATGGLAGIQERTGNTGLKVTIGNMLRR